MQHYVIHYAFYTKSAKLHTATGGVQMAHNLVSCERVQARPDGPFGACDTVLALDANRCNRARVAFAAPNSSAMRRRRGCRACLQRRQSSACAAAARSRSACAAEFQTKRGSIAAIPAARARNRRNGSLHLLRAVQARAQRARWACMLHNRIGERSGHAIGAHGRCQPSRVSMRRHETQRLGNGRERGSFKFSKKRRSLPVILSVPRQIELCWKGRLRCTVFMGRRAAVSKFKHPHCQACVSYEGRDIAGRAT
eukprot:IDg17064t1